MKGNVHSIESFGTVDGPGIRLVIFMQGCPLRCKYCHNPDTWKMGQGDTRQTEEIIALFKKNRSFYSNGGITVTGGEPLLQIEFVTELFRLAKAEGIHTCLDTSGITYRENDPDFDELIKYTDLVMLDIKHIDSACHKELTGSNNYKILAFARYLDTKGIPVWIRHVVVPGITDKKEYLLELGRYIGTLSNVKALDVLPYHTMGVSKYRELGMKYPLAGLEPMSTRGAVEAKKVILAGYREKKAEISSRK
ncbi:MAG: pyruvate formate lyase-activating protein [Ruminococcaceae bacterium]|nr:pyruvate formate lyase-activating protein [Oscillospiraceae bacterium]